MKESIRSVELLQALAELNAALCCADHGWYQPKLGFQNTQKSQRADIGLTCPVGWSATLLAVQVHAKAKFHVMGSFWTMAMGYITLMLRGAGWREKREHASRSSTSILALCPP